jgi:uncharacterized protein (TIGR02246 family)
MKRLICSLATMSTAVLLVPTAWPGATERPAPQEKALHAARAKAMIAAFDKGDAAALAAFWTANGDYMDEGGRRYQGRKAIEEYFEKLFAASKGARLHVHRTAFRLVRPDLAIADGIMEVVPPGGGPTTSARYTSVQVKQDGQWLIESLREAAATPPSQAEKLEDVAWLVGDWTEESKKGEQIHLSYSWAENNNFLVGQFTTTLKEVPLAGGTQWIAWDPAARSIRSWVFDSTGSISEATWTRAGDQFFSKTTTTLPDGKRATSTNVVTRLDPDHMTVQWTRRAVDGKALPDTKVVKLVRLP